MHAHLFRSLKKYGAVMVITMQNNMAYAGEVLYRSFFMLLLIYIFIHLWKSTYASAGTSQVAGISLTQLLWYLVITETIIISKSSFSRNISEEVKGGSLAYTIGRPCNYILYHCALGAGDMAVRLIINFSAGAALTVIMAGPPSFDMATLPAILVVIILGLMLDFCIEGLIGLTAFITEDVAGLQLIYNKILFILGGLLIPLDFYPSWLKHIAQVLPFNLILYGPAKLFISFSTGAWLQMLGLQIIWITAAALILSLSFNLAVRRLSINGG